MALAMVKLLKLLPEQAMAGQLPQALQGVAHLLRNRLQRIRYEPYTLYRRRRPCSPPAQTPSQHQIQTLHPNPKDPLPTSWCNRLQRITKL